MNTTAIEWTDVVWNPTTGCDKVSPGCGLPRWDGDTPHGQCYALTMANRLKGMGQAKYQNDGDPRTSGPGFGLTVHEDTLPLPLRWHEPRRVFVNSMSDLFHAGVPDGFIAAVFAIMAMTPQHTYQVLTKRPGRMRSLLSRATFAHDVAEAGHGLAGCSQHWLAAGRMFAGPLTNVWLGVSVENQRWADVRIPALLATPAAVRFLSCEPLLGAVDLYRRLYPQPCPAGCGCRWPDDGDRRECGCDGPCTSETWHPAPGIDWIIAGGESGPGARPMHPDWARDLRDQADSAGVPFFFKQWGAWAPAARGGWYSRTTCVALDGQQHSPSQPCQAASDAYLYASRSKGLRELDGRTWDQYPADLADQDRDENGAWS